MLGKTPRVSVVLLTHNSAKTIRNVLEGVVKQKYTDYEIIVIDSESKDETLNIVKDYPSKIISIKSKDFGHGKTRNYATELVKSEFLVFLTHDSVPEKDNWLEEILKPFENKKVVGVYGRQIPRKNENSLDKHFQMGLYGSKEIKWNKDNWHQGDNLFSDANSAVRREILINHPYESNIIVSEDYEWAIRVLRLGFNIVYNPKASVIHSHSYNLYTLFKRNFDVGVSYIIVYENVGLHHFIKNGLKILYLEIKYLKESGSSKLIPQALARDIVRFIAIQLGKHERMIPKSIKQNYLSSQGWYWK